MQRWGHAHGDGDGVGGGVNLLSRRLVPSPARANKCWDYLDVERMQTYAARQQPLSSLPRNVLLSPGDLANPLRRLEHLLSIMRCNTQQMTQHKILAFHLNPTHSTAIFKLTCCFYNVAEIACRPSFTRPAAPLGTSQE